MSVLGDKSVKEIYMGTEVKTLNSELNEKKVWMKFVSVGCQVCGRTWGVTLEPGEDTIPAKKLVCLSCLSEKYLDS